MFRFAVAGALATAEASTLAVTWKDCGAKHATVTDVQPSTIQMGATETLTGTGILDEDVTSAQFTATLSALGAKLTECSGDATSDIVCTLPMGVGKITVKAVNYPLAKGTVQIPVEVQTSFYIPPSLANVDVHIAATEQNGESVICLDVHTAQQQLKVEEVDKTVEIEKAVEITLPWLTNSCSNKGHCGNAYQACCIGFQAKGFPCGCHLADGGSGQAIGDCGDCGAAYKVCCAGYAATGNACTCDVSDGGVVV